MTAVYTTWAVVDVQEFVGRGEAQQAEIGQSLGGKYPTAALEDLVAMAPPNIIATKPALAARIAGAR